MNEVEIYYVDKRKINIDSVNELNPAKAIRQAAKELLLSAALGITSSSLSQNQYGKPLLPYDDNRHFNISHARDYSVIAVSSGEIGIDIEEIKTDNRRRKYDEMTARRVFSDEYYKEFSDSDESQKKYVFTKLWTQLEAILKANGTGFHLDPRKSPEIFSNWKIQNIELGDHIISVAMREPFSYRIMAVN